MVNTSLELKDSTLMRSSCPHVIVKPWPGQSERNKATQISNLPKKLSTGDAPCGQKPSAGDIAYCAPWGNLALLHTDFEHSPGLVKLGSIDSGVETLRERGPLKVTIEQIKK